MYLISRNRRGSCLGAHPRQSRGSLAGFVEHQHITVKRGDGSMKTGGVADPSADGKTYNILTYILPLKPTQGPGFPSSNAGGTTSGEPLRPGDVTFSSRSTQDGASLPATFSVGLLGIPRTRTRDGSKDGSPYFHHDRPIHPNTDALDSPQFRRSTMNQGIRVLLLVPTKRTTILHPPPSP